MYHTLVSYEQENLKSVIKEKHNYPSIHPFFNK